MNSQELLAIAVDAIDNKKGEDTISLENERYQRYDRLFCCNARK